MRFPDRMVRALQCSPGKSEIRVADDALPGFVMRLKAGGAPLFLFQYRHAGIIRRITLGRFGVLTTGAAQRKARALSGAVAEGRDPWAERKAAVAQAKADAAEAALTVRALIEDFDRRHLSGKRPSCRRDFLSRMRQHLAPIRDTPAAQVTRRQAVQVMDAARDNAGATTAPACCNTPGPGSGGRASDR